MTDRNTHLDKEAIGRSEGARSAGESSSKSTKRKVKPSFDVEAWLRKIEKIQASPSFIKAMEEVVNGRLKRSRKRN